MLRRKTRFSFFGFKEVIFIWLAVRCYPELTKFKVKDSLQTVKSVQEFKHQVQVCGFPKTTIQF